MTAPDRILTDADRLAIVREALPSHATVDDAEFRRFFAHTFSAVALTESRVLAAMQGRIREAQREALTRFANEQPGGGMFHYARLIAFRNREYPAPAPPEPVCRCYFRGGVIVAVPSEGCPTHYPMGIGGTVPRRTKGEA